MLPKYQKPPHPGQILWEEFLKPLDISQTEFVKHLDGSWTQPKLSAIIHGKRAVTESVALDLADALGTTAEFWINMQKGVDMWNARKKHKKIMLFPVVKQQTKKSKRLSKVA